MKLRIYIDTSVIGGCLDEEFKEASRKLLNKFISGAMTAVLSELTVVELQKAPQEVKNILNQIPEDHIERLYLTEEAAQLAQRYIKEGVLVKNKLVDAQHIAIATLNRVSVVVSWNFRHIVNLERIRGFNAVNLKLGYPLLEIRSPREVLTYEEQKEI